LMANSCWAGIEVPRNECVWLNGHYGNEIKCDGNQVVVGACGAGRYGDCPGDSWHQLLCCTLPNFYYGHCMKYGSAHGELNSCLSHGNVPYLLEGMIMIFINVCVRSNFNLIFLIGTCGSGAELDCDGYSVGNDCCEGHLFSGWYSNIIFILPSLPKKIQVFFYF